MNISFFDILCLRIPAYSSQYYKIPENHIIQLIDDDAFMDAIFVASPDFYQRCKIWKNGQVTDEKKIRKIKSTLLKYYNRMCYRSTPFGLFSSCSTVNWGNATSITITTNGITPKIRLDTSFLGLLIESLEQKFRENLSYTINSSLYKVGNEYRYYEYENNNGKRQYKINAVETDDELDYTLNLLTGKSIPLKQLGTKISEYFEADESIINDYLNQLIDTQLIVSTLQAKLSDINPLKTLLDTLKSILADTGSHALHHYVNIIDELNLALNKPLHNAGLSPHLQNMAEIAALTPINFNVKELFQVDSYSLLNKKTIDKALQQQLAKAIKVLQVLNSQNNDDSWLQNIKRKIRDKFENKPVLLTHLFDPDIGISDSATNSSISFGNVILNELNSFLLSQDSSETSGNNTGNPVKQYFNQKLKEISLHGSQTITITEDEIKKLENAIQIKPLPDTFPIMFKIIKEDGATLMIDSAGGASGTTLIGRFGKDNKELFELLQEIALFEKRVNEDTVIAAIVHLPQNRVGNVMQNPCIRDYEIPYLSASSLPLQNQIAVNDIYVYLEGDKLRLYSAKLRKNIIPRIDNAHNYTGDSLPIYRLFGALQNEGQIKHLGINFSMSLNGIQFSPRVSYNKTILKSAQWVLEKDDLDCITGPKDIDNAVNQLNTKFKKWNIPTQFLWAQNDQTILVDTTHEATLHLFIEGIRGMGLVTIKEFIKPDSTCVTDTDNNYFDHQLVAVARYQNNNNAFKQLKPFVNNTEIQRAFFPGSEWYYYKIYCSVFFSDKVLSNIILPLCNNWKARRLIDKWFFIRYNDPENHIRLRFHLSGVNNKQTIADELYLSLKQYLGDGLIWKTQTDTYNRELERYTVQAYPVIEQFFDLDSTYCIQLINNKEIYDEANVPLLWLSIKKLDDIFSLFSFSLNEKLGLALNASRSLQEEFDITPTEKDIIHRHYHANKNQLKELLENEAYQTFNNILTYGTLLHISSNNELFAANKLLFSDKKANPQIATSLVHMHFNRLYNSDQRRFEMIGYQIICLYYQAQIKFNEGAAKRNMP